MKRFDKKIWEEGEYNYKAAYGFTPNIHAYIHDDDEKRDCMIVVPGGGYCMVVPPEGCIPAMEFYKKGMNVFVLTYTTDITFSVPLKDQPMNDLARAIRFIKKNACEYNVDLKKMIICGFSAGAHVCGSLAVHYKDIKDQNPDYSDISIRVDGAILSYPVITTGEFTHEYSVLALLGNDPSQEELDHYSLEKQVDEDTVPCFIWQTLNDDLVPIENSYLFANALREKGVRYAHYVFPDGFHGLSVPNEDFFAGKFEDYTMEQVFKAVRAVKAGEGIGVSKERCEELKIQFADMDDKEAGLSDKGAGHSDKEEEHVDKEADSLKERTGSQSELYKDVALWPDLAVKWIERL